MAIGEAYVRESGVLVECMSRTMSYLHFRHETLSLKRRAAGPMIHCFLQTLVSQRVLVKRAVFPVILQSCQAKVSQRSLAQRAARRLLSHIETLQRVGRGAQGRSRLMRQTEITQHLPVLQAWGRGVLARVRVQRERYLRNAQCVAALVTRLVKAYRSRAWLARYRRRARLEKLETREKEPPPPPRSASAGSAPNRTTAEVLKSASSIASTKPAHLFESSKSRMQFERPSSTTLGKISVLLKEEHTLRQLLEREQHDHLRSAVTEANERLEFNLITRSGGLFTTLARLEVEQRESLRREEAESWEMVFVANRIIVEKVSIKTVRQPRPFSSPAMTAGRHRAPSAAPDVRPVESEKPKRVPAPTPRMQVAPSTTLNYHLATLANQLRPSTSGPICNEEIQPVKESLLHEALPFATATPYNARVAEVLNSASRIASTDPAHLFEPSRSRAVRFPRGK